jgi:hypothetical protein
MGGVGGNYFLVSIMCIARGSIGDFYVKIEDAC